MSCLSTRFRGRLGLAALGLFVSMLFVAPALGDLPGLRRVRSLQSLAYTIDGVFGHYFQADPDTGEFSLNLDRDENNSGSYWQFELVHRHRDYGRVYSLQQRGNGVFNSWYLAVDEETQQLRLVPHRENWSSKWRIRYAGKHNGYDAFVVQTVAELGTSDMKFLSLDPVTRRPQLSRELDDTGYWFLDVVSDLPTDF
ncbi:MAG: hypothetical protein DWQ31_03630 [Planctomycetota bacterium]|nr:MAG: hypothetical protein DWQ31_03630 [Planctomycetota bacterium]REJ93974.1 MAG: hypothetical protein DWQ35_09420 [Planctomycetota bacterium]REK30954.1 MAG: hypothetical protein DWQ42_01245 [Planctomycetota bacterium]REK38206.1 MAG: hypothetical protein DWQ46_20980 [Planctomycetota bacterium]